VKHIEQLPYHEFIKKDAVSSPDEPFFAYPAVVSQTAKLRVRCSDFWRLFDHASGLAVAF
jgi:hypothetical protein